MLLGDPHSVSGILGRQGHCEARGCTQGWRVCARCHPLRVALDNGPVHVPDELLHLAGTEPGFLGKDLRFGGQLLKANDKDISVAERSD